MVTCMMKLAARCLCIGLGSWDMLITREMDPSSKLHCFSLYKGPLRAILRAFPHVVQFKMRRASHLCCHRSLPGAIIPAFPPPRLPISGSVSHATLRADVRSRQLPISKSILFRGAKSTIPSKSSSEEVTETGCLSWHL